jgi:hypothetical protein
MTDQPKPPPASSPALTEAGLRAKQEREARSAAALRENLRRRKAQARARATPPAAAPPSPADDQTGRDPEGG